MNLNSGLVIGRGGVNLRLTCRNGGVTINHLGHDAAQSLNAQGKRGNIQKDNALNVAGQNAALNSCAHCYNLIGVHGHVRLLAGQALNKLLNSGHTRGTANQNDFVQLASTHTGILQSLLYRNLAALQQVLGNALELNAGQRVIQMLRARCIHGDVRQVDVGLAGCGKLHLRALGSFLQTLQSHGVLAQVNALIA